jgi:hypothetical protein
MQLSALCLNNKVWPPGGIEWWMLCGRGRVCERHCMRNDGASERENYALGEGQEDRRCNTREFIQMLCIFWLADAILDRGKMKV